MKARKTPAKRSRSARAGVRPARRDSRLEKLRRDYRAAHDQQTATAEILRAISASRSSAKSVFEAIAKSALDLLHGWSVAVARFDGKLLHLEAVRGAAPEAEGVLLTPQPSVPEREFTIGRSVLERTASQESDCWSSPSGRVRTRSRLRGYRSVLSVPMLREGEAIGAISVARKAAGEFAPDEVELLKTFADQAVIAIENVRLFNELQERNRALTESLEQQTASGEILRVISSSHTDVQPVFDTIIRNAVRLCDGALGAVFRFDGERIHVGALCNLNPEAEELFRRTYPQPPSGENPGAQAILERRVVNFEDIEASDYSAAAKARARASGYRAGLAVPMLHNGAPIGSIAVARRTPGRFANSYVSLLQTFADQAVIAIENVRLFNETQESLERQTATSEILGVISKSQSDIQPVLDAVAERAERLCEGGSATLYLREGDTLRRAAVHGAFVWPGAAITLPFDRGSGIGRATIDCAPIHIHDIKLQREEFPAGWKLVEQHARSVGLAENHTQVAVPLVKDGAAIGAIMVRRTEVRPFTEKQIDLLKIFADQAVIAIENVRLFREIQEKTAQLEIANKHKSEFLANMSHELRTPLNAVIGFSEVLLERMFGEVNEKQADYLKDIHESGRHLLSLINDILDLSKIEAGRMELELSRFHLPTAISNAMTLIRERAQRHGIQLGSEVDPRLGEFQADERKVKQILLNLLSNAVKFTPDGGRVEVSAKLDTTVVEIAVRDTGIGIAPEDQGSLFEEFRQVGTDYTRKSEGTGLGLALTKRFVELHGGAVRVESAPGKGSTFTVSLPVR